MPAGIIKRYRTQDAEPGMILAKTILTGQGKVIMEQGQVILQEGSALTGQWIDRLTSRNIRVVDVRLPAGMAPKKAQDEHAVLDGVLAGEPVSETLDKLAQWAGDQFSGEHVFISIIEGDPPRWWVIASASSFRIEDAGLEAKFRSADYLAGANVLIPDLSAHRVPPVLTRADMLTMLGVPICVDHRTVGVIELFSPKTNAFSAESVQIAERMAKEAALSIRASRCNEVLRAVTSEKDLLHAVMEKVALSLPPEKLLATVADNLGKYLNAHAIAAFFVHRLAVGIKPVDILSRNFSKNDMEALKEIMREKWSLNQQAERQHFQVSFAGTKSLAVIPLFAGDLLQGVIALLWDYDRRPDQHSHLDDTIRIVAAQTAIGMERKQLYSGMEKIGLTDTLTGLANRRMFDFLVEREINRCRRYGRPVSLVMFDIDHFKKVNDTWGHQTGDLILKEIGYLMRANFRKLDFPARYGGEEFAVILPETPLEEAVSFAERFRVLVERTFFSNGREKIPITVSLGVASLGLNSVAEALASEDFVHYADSALYEAKRAGRNRVVVSRN